MGTTNLFFSTLPLGSFSHLAIGSILLENTGKMNLIPKVMRGQIMAFVVLGMLL
jgi:hypothetical protein